MEQAEQTMKISANIIRRLRVERGWSQEQLATASGLGLRTIQRVEAEGRASRETRVCLAATFDVALSQLIEDSSPLETVKTTPFLRHYKVALIAAGIALLPVLLNMTGTIANSLLVSVLSMIVIPLALYGSFGWYFTGQPQHSSRGKRYVQIVFIAVAIFLAFAFFAQSGANAGAISVAAQFSILVLGVYFLLDYVLSRRSHD